MKKFLMIGTLCFALMAFTGSAFADFGFEGLCRVNYIAMASSNSNDVPTGPCILCLTITVNGETFDVIAEASGTLINVGLLKAWNENLQVSCKGGLELGKGPDGQGFKVFLKKIDFFRNQDPWYEY